MRVRGPGTEATTDSLEGLYAGRRGVRFRRMNPRFARLAMSADRAIEVSNLRVVRGATEVLHDISLTVVRAP